MGRNCILHPSLAFVLVSSSVFFFLIGQLAQIRKAQMLLLEEMTHSRNASWSMRSDRGLHLSETSCGQIL